MPLENRNLEAGTRLVARYRKQDRTCEVVETEKGLRYRLDDGTEHTSPSSAGRAVTKGVAVNGWRFWSLEGDAPPPREAKPKTAKKPAARKAPAKKGGGKKPAAKKPKADAYGCGVCPETFATMKAATKHAMEAHTAA